MTGANTTSKDTGGENDPESIKINKSKKRKLSEKESSIATQNRRSAQASRTLRACDLCRKQKTRCFRSPESINSCLRCTFLSKPCSFGTNADTVILQQHPQSLVPKEQFDLKKKLDSIHNGVNELLALMKGGGHISDNDARLLLETANSMKKSSTPSTPSLPLDNAHNKITIGNSYGSALSQTDIMESLKDAEVSSSQSTFQSPTYSLKSSPFSIVSNQVETANIPHPIIKLLNLSTVPRSRIKPNIFTDTDDMISLGILSESEAINLMDDFRRNYGRWASFPQNIPTQTLIDKIRSKSSLLLSTCCCLSLRYSLNGVSPGNIDIFNRKLNHFRALMKHLVVDLNKSLLKNSCFQHSTMNSGDIEFLQSLVILSLYSSSISSIAASQIHEISEIDKEFDSTLSEFNLDPWYLSGIGLTTFITKATFGTLFNFKENQLGGVSDNLLEVDSPFTLLYNELDSDESQKLTTLRIYNHLILVHLINSVFSGRMCVVDEIRLNYCTFTLGLPTSTNFDGRMVSEIGILLIAYNYIQVNLNAGVSSNLKDCENGFLSVKEELKLWYDQWEYLFSQPALQFVELCYDFCYLLIYFCYNFQKYELVKENKSANLSSHGQSFSETYNENNIQFVLCHCDEDSLVKIMEHSNNVVRIVNVIESDSYFAYLSDQLHFCFYFSALCLVKILDYLISSGQDSLLNKVYKEDEVFDNGILSDALKDINSLIEKYGRVGQNNPNDIISKYKNSLETSLKNSLHLNKAQ